MARRGRIVEGCRSTYTTLSGHGGLFSDRASGWMGAFTPLRTQSIGTDPETILSASASTSTPTETLLDSQHSRTPMIRLPRRLIALNERSRRFFRDAGQCMLSRSWPHRDFNTRQVPKPRDLERRAGLARC